MSDLKMLIDGMESRISSRMEEKIAAALSTRAEQPSPPSTAPSPVTVAATAAGVHEGSDLNRSDIHTTKPIHMTQHRQRVLTERAERVMSTAQGANKDILGAPTHFLSHMQALLDPHQPPTADADLDDDAYDGEHMSQVGMSGKMGGGGGGNNGKLGAGFHPDLFRTDTLDRPDVIRVLGNALSSASKQNTKFKSMDQMVEIFHAQVTLIQNERIDVVHRLTQWTKYERHVMRLLMDKGLDAASKYHFDLFSRMRAGEHDLWNDGYYNPQVMRDVDVAYPNKSFLSSSNNKKGKGGARPKANGIKFTGEPCKHHGPHSKHTTSECKDPESRSSRK